MASCSAAQYEVREVYSGKKGALQTIRATTECQGLAYVFEESTATFRSPVQPDVRLLFSMFIKKDTWYVVAPSAKSEYLRRLATMQAQTAAHPGCPQWVESQLAVTDMAVVVSSDRVTIAPSVRASSFNHVCWPSVSYGLDELRKGFLLDVFGPPSRAKQ